MKLGNKPSQSAEKTASLNARRAGKVATHVLPTNSGALAAAKMDKHAKDARRTTGSHIPTRRETSPAQTSKSNGRRVQVRVRLSLTVKFVSSTTHVFSLRKYQSAGQRAKASAIGRRAIDVDYPVLSHGTDSSDNEKSRATLTKRRNVKKKRGSSARGASGGKSKATDEAKAAHDSDERVGVRLAKEKCPTPKQLKFYSGTILELLKDAIFFARVYFLTVNGFPSTCTLYKCAKYSYKGACRSKYGAVWKGMSKFRDSSRLRS